MNWTDIRKNYPLVNNNIYLDTARTGAISRQTADTLKDHIDDFLNNGALHREDWIDTKEEARGKVAQILDVEKASVGFLTDVSTGMSFLASAMKKFSRVLLIEDDFPSVGIPWIRAGYKITWIKKEEDRSIDLNKIEEALKTGIDVLPISWVQYNSGYRIDLQRLGELCDQYNANLVVDGTQGFCAMPLSLRSSSVKAFLASAFKWGTAGYGIASMYIQNDLGKELNFEAGGWNSLIDFFGSWEDNSNYKQSTELLEIAHPKYANLITLNHAFGELQKIGVDSIQNRTLHLSNHLQESLREAGIETLSNFDPNESSGIRLVRTTKEQFKTLSAEGVNVTFREDYLRVAPYFYNLEEDINRFVELMINTGQ